METIEKTKQEKIKAEFRKLKGIFKNMDKNTKKLAESLIQNAAFMKVTLEDLQEIVNEEGPVGEYTNGNGKTAIQESPAQKSYVSMVQKYTQTIKVLNDMLPDAKERAAAKAGTQLAAFIKQGKMPK